MAEWWEADETVSDAPAGWGSEDETVEIVAEEDTAPRGLLDVLKDAFSQEEVVTTEEAVGRDTVDEHKALMQNLTAVAPGVFIPLRMTLGDENVAAAAEAAGTIVSGALAEPVSGVAGLAGAALPGPAGQGAEVAQATQEALTYEPTTVAGQELLGDIGSFLEPVGEAFGAVEGGLGGATLEATGSPALATAAHVAPTALLEMLGLGILKKPSQAARNAAKAQTRMKIDPDATPDEVLKEMTLPEERTYLEITDDLRKGKAKALAEAVRPDHEIIAAADELGVDLNPSAYSTSQAYQRVEQALKSQPGSDLAAREADAIAELGQRSDDLIREIGGELDKRIMDERVQTRIDGNIKDLATKTEQIYKRVNDAIPPATKVRARASQAYITQRLNELGGDVSLLTTAERKLHGMLQGDRPPTYNALDTVRRDIGDAYKRQGPFKDDTSGTLDQVYSALITDQRGVARAFGDDVGAAFDAGRKLVATRKQMEKGATQLYGRELAGSIIGKLSTAGTKLTAGDVSNFKNIMKAVPADQRTMVAATMLNDIFTAGARRKGASIGQGFANAYEGLNRNATAKAELFKYLPPAAQKRFDAIGRVSTGIFRARALENTSRTARDVLQALQQGGLIEKVYGKTRPLAYMTGGAMVGMAADMTASAVKSGAKRVEKADALLNSPGFGRALNKAMEGKVKEAEIMLKRSPAWQSFRNALGEGTKAQLAAVGPIAWLTQQEELAPAPQPTDQVTPPTQAGQPAGMPPVGPPAEIMQGGQ